MDSNHTLLISSEDVQKIVQHFGLNRVMDDLIHRLEQLILSYDPKKTHIPMRSGFNYQQPHAGLVEWMPVFEKSNQVVIKVVGYHPENPKAYALPTILSTISAYDIRTGHLSALMDGVLATALRTGAASAIASRYLAKPESKTLGLIGCGAQAVTQLHALSRIFDLQKVFMYDVDPVAMKTLPERCLPLNLSVQMVPKEMPAIIAESDILCTATSLDVHAGPLFEDQETLAHLHINAVGSDFPGKIEVPKALLERSFVCPDFIEQALVEGECQQLDQQFIGPELYSLLQNASDHAEVWKQTSIFDSTGWALEDQVTMDLFIEYAQTLQVGQKVLIENTQEDAKSPYHFMQASVLK